MRAGQQRVLVRPVANTFYRSSARRGIWSIRQFPLGLNFLWHHLPDGRIHCSPPAAEVIDIAVFRVWGLTDAALTGSLLSASKPTGYIPSVPKDQGLLACEQCRGILWHNTLRRYDNVFMQSICVGCGFTKRIFRPTHSVAGHA